MNRLGFVYVPAGIKKPGSAYHLKTIQSNPTSLRVSWEDRSSFVKVSRDGLNLYGDKGHRSARCNAPVREGKWYMEVTIGQGGGDDHGMSKREGSHVRLGWGRREASVNGPVGLDGYSYGYRDKTGEKVTLSRAKPYGKPFKTGDVIGMYISLPSKRKPDDSDTRDPAHMKRLRIAIDFKGQEYFESLDYPQSRDMIALMDYSGKTGPTSSVPSTKKSATTKNLPDRGRNHPSNAPASKKGEPLRPLPTLAESCIAFFVNGESQGIAFNDLYDYLQLRSNSANKKEKGRTLREGARKHQENPFDDGSLGYYPFISLFNYASVSMNPGPDFAFPPPNDIDALLDGREALIVSSEEDVKPQPTWRPMCERYAEYMQEQWALDEVDEEEAKVAIAEADVEEAKTAARQQKRSKRAEAAKKTKLHLAPVPVTPTFTQGTAAAFIANPQPTYLGPYDRVVPMDEDRPTSAPGYAPHGYLHEPSPLRNEYVEPESLTAYSSPAASSNIEETVPSGVQSGYNSEPMDPDAEGEDVESDQDMEGGQSGILSNDTSVVDIKGIEFVDPLSV